MYRLLVVHPDAALYAQNSSSSSSSSSSGGGGSSSGGGVNSRFVVSNSLTESGKNSVPEARTNQCDASGGAVLAQY